MNRTLVLYSTNFVFIRTVIFLLQEEQGLM